MLTQEGRLLALATLGVGTGLAALAVGALTYRQTSVVRDRAATLTARMDRKGPYFWHDPEEEVWTIWGWKSRRDLADMRRGGPSEAWPQ